MSPSKTQRNLSVLRQLSGSATTAMAPHAAYMKITTLELEKLRLNKAREHALRRVGEIDARLRELDAQKAALLSCLGAARGAPPTPGIGAKGLRPSGGGSRVRLTY
jgi:hypothetical protein